MEEMSCPTSSLPPDLPNPLTCFPHLIFLPHKTTHNSRFCTNVLQTFLALTERFVFRPSSPQSKLPLKKYTAIAILDGLD